MDTQAVPIPLQPDITDSGVAGAPQNDRGDQTLKQVQGDSGGIFYEVIIIGGGPAAVGAAIYTARKKLKTLLVAIDLNGQSVVSDDIRNWIGDVSITGLELSKRLEAHVRAYPEEVTIKLGEKALEVKSVACVTSSTPGESKPTPGMSAGRICDFEVKTDKGTYRGKTVIVASGARRRKLGIPGEDKFEGKGVAYCSTCDAPLFVGKRVVVVGGGNAGLEAAQDLFQYASEVTILEFGDSLKADALTQEEVKRNTKLKGVILNAQTLEVLGDTMVTGIKFKDRKTNEEKTLEVGGIFVEIGSVPNSEMVKDLVQIDEHKQIIINFQHARTSHPGIFAAGDVTNDPYKQNNISVGDGVRAALAAHAYLMDREKHSPAAEH